LGEQVTFGVSSETAPQTGQQWQTQIDEVVDQLNKLEQYGEEWFLLVHILSVKCQHGQAIMFGLEDAPFPRLEKISTG